MNCSQQCRIRQQLLIKIIRMPYQNTSAKHVPILIPICYPFPSESALLILTRGKHFPIRVHGMDCVDGRQYASLCKQRPSRAQTGGCSRRPHRTPKRPNMDFGLNSVVVVYVGYQPTTTEQVFARNHHHPPLLLHDDDASGLSDGWDRLEAILWCVCVNLVK